MRNRLDSTFVRKEAIAERLVRRAAELWGVEHPDHVDPVVKLMVDVIAFELAGLGTEMSVSDGKLLENLANILVPGSWLMPRPSHAVMTAQPLEVSGHLNRNNQFYIPIKDKAITGEETITDLFFAPLSDVELIKGNIDRKIVQNIIYRRETHDHFSRKRASFLPTPDFHGLWIGIHLDQEITQLEALGIYIDLPEKTRNLSPFLEQIQWKLETGEQLNSTAFGDRQNQEPDSQFDGQVFALLHPERAILNDISEIYRHRIFTLSSANSKGISLVKKRIPKALEAHLSADDRENFEEELLWLKVEFPAVFRSEILHEIQFSMNCFPVVSKRLHYGQVRLHAGSNIIPLRLPESGVMFYVNKVWDDQGKNFRKRQFNTETHQAGSYLIHQGDLERFDRVTAETYLAKMIRLVQEESAMFSAYGQDLMLKQMTNLRNDLEAIRRQIGTSGTSYNSERHYLLVEPTDSSKTLEYEYWSIEQRSFKNYVHVGSTLLPYKQVSVQPGSARMKTGIISGKGAPDLDEKVRALRYGLLTRDRVVSKQDVRQFVLYALQGFVKSVEIKNGVAISGDPKRGLVRTVDVLLTPVPRNELSTEEWSVLLTGLQGNLNHRSVHSAEYQIKLVPTA